MPPMALLAGSTKQGLVASGVPGAVGVSPVPRSRLVGRTGMLEAGYTE